MASTPNTFQKLMVQKLTTDFRAAVTIKTVPICQPKDGEICVKIRYVGVNATDVNISKGRYMTDDKLPFDVGVEGVGEIVKVGNGVTSLKEGDAIAFLSSAHNTYAEYACMPTKNAFKIPEAKPEYVALLISGLAAAIGLDKSARIVNGETVLITAAAGGTGHLAVQWAKAANCHVIGTCSSKEKEEVLKNLGCDRIINYKTEDLGAVLAKEYPQGINVIWETIGGSVLETCLRNLSVKGRLIIVGGISGYKEENKGALQRSNLATLPEILLVKSAAVIGFLMLHYSECFPTYFNYLKENLESGKIKAIYDLGKDKEFVGLEGIIDGIEHLHSGKSIGKVMAKIS